MFEIAGGILLAIAVLWVLRLVLGLLGIAITVAGASPRPAAPPAQTPAPAAATAPSPARTLKSGNETMAEFVARYALENVAKGGSLEEFRNYVNAALFEVIDPNDRGRLASIMDGLSAQQKASLILNALEHPAHYLSLTRLKLNQPPMSWAATSESARSHK